MSLNINYLHLNMSSINTYFSQKDNLRNIILQNLETASGSVQIAVAWFTDVRLFKKLLELQSKGVKVELIITNHQFNHESKNNYSLIQENGGVFIKIGGDYNTMHHKFCIVDHRILLQGSFNWTRKANDSNNETLLVIKDDGQAINEFAEEFERLKRIAGLETERTQLEISKALKFFTLFKTYIDLGKTSELNPLLHEIKNVQELKSATELLFSGRYEEAVIEMDNLTKLFTGVTVFKDIEKEELVFKIRLISEQIKQVEIEITEVEEQVSHFNRRYILELNPLIAAVILLKRRIYEKLKQSGIFDETFEELSQEYEKVKTELEEEEENDVPDLSVDEINNLKKMYHEASTLCHPDSSKCVIEDKSQAQAIFSSLSTAYKSKDFNKVKEIYNELKSGIFNPHDIGDSELGKLRNRYAALEYKFGNRISVLRKLKTTEPYLFLADMPDWDVFFEAQRVLLTKQKEDLESKYFKS